MYARTFPPHPKANKKGLYPLHRVVLENKLGRLLEHWEHAHHINENKNDNRPENLMVITVWEHSKLHAKNREVTPEKIICPNCHKEFEAYPRQIRSRINRNKSGKIFCSLSCGSSKPK